MKISIFPNNIIKLTFFSLSFILALAGCKAKDPAPTAPTPVSNISMSVLGLSNFGNVVAGDFRESTVKIKNNTNASVDVILSANDPFSILKLSPPCSSGSLPGGQSCTFVVHFAPTAFGSFNTSFSVGDSSVQFSGKGLIGGDLALSNLNIDLGQINAGIEYFQTLTITNTGDFTIPFPLLTNELGYNLNNNCRDSNNNIRNCEISLISNYCGSSISPHVSCDIKFLIVQKTLGFQTQSINLTATSPSSGVSTVPILFSSTVLPGSPSGNIAFLGNAPLFNVDITNDTLIKTQPITDQFGNQVIDGTPINVTLSNLILDETTSTFLTSAGSISFHVRPTTTKGNATISISSGTAYGSLLLYVRAGAPAGSLTLQPYNQSMIADGVTQLGLRFNTIYDKFGNIIEDGTVIPATILGGGSISPATITSFQGSTQFNVTSGSTTGTATIQVRINPIFDINNSIVDYTAKGDFVIQFIPGDPFGTIPILTGVGGMNAVNDITLVTIGPLRDKTNNIVKQNTPMDISISNGNNISNTGNSLVTDQFGKAQFILKGSGNRGPIVITASTIKASGQAQVWAYKDSHLTLQGQKRDDWGLGAGSNIINSGRAYTKYGKYASTTASLPDVNDVWDEVFDYNKLTISDRSYYQMQHLNGSPISSSGNSGTAFPLNVPIPPSNPGATNYQLLLQNPTILSYTQQPLIPYLEAPMFYSAGEKLMSSPTWSTLKPSGGTNIFACAEGDGKIPSHDLFNMIMYTSNNNTFICENNGVVATSTSANDRRRDDTRSDFYWPLVGYVEDPVGCSFDASQSPTYNLQFGEFLPSADNSRTITIFNPNPLAINSLSWSFVAGTDPNWSVSSSDCTSNLDAQASCSLVVKYNNPTNQSIVYSTTLQIQSSAVSSDVVVTVKINPAGVVQNFTTPVGTVNLKSNCYSKLAIFGGYNFPLADPTQPLSIQNKVVSAHSNLLSIYNVRGQIVSRFDNQCGVFTTQQACLNGNGCFWTPADPNNQGTIAQCDNLVDLGAFPAVGKAMAPFVQIQRKLYTFSGFFPAGVGGASNDPLGFYDTETGKWGIVPVDPDPALAGQIIVEPQARYQFAMTYVPENTTLYVFGGITPGLTSSDSDIKLDDLWAVNLFPAPVLDSNGDLNPVDPHWTRICQHCGVPTPYISIARDDANPGPGYATSPVVPYMLWNKPNKTMYIFWQGRSDIAYQFNPLASSISVQPIDSTSGAAALAGAFQVIFNERTGRMFSYHRGTPSADINSYVAPTIHMWDMDAGTKNYFRTRFKLGDGSKAWATVLTPRIKAYGSSGADPSCGDPCGGVQAYIYNYDAATWDLIGDNNSFADSQIGSLDEITNAWNDAEAKKRISTDGYVDILVLPKGNPSYYNQLFVDSVYLDGTF